MNLPKVVIAPGHRTGKVVRVEAVAYTEMSLSASIPTSSNTARKGKRGPPFATARATLSPSQGCASAPCQVALLTIGPCGSGLPSCSSWRPLNGCSEPGRGPGTGAQQAREGADGNPIREKGETAGISSSVAGSLPSAGMPNSPSFRAELHSLYLPPSSSALLHLLPPLSLSLSFFPSSSSSSPAAPPFFPPPSLVSLSGMGAPPTSSHPAAGASPRRPWSRKPGQRPSPQLPPGLGRRCLPHG